MSHVAFDRILSKFNNNDIVYLVIDSLDRCELTENKKMRLFSGESDISYDPIAVYPHQSLTKCECFDTGLGKIKLYLIEYIDDPVIKQYDATSLNLYLESVHHMLYSGKVIMKDDKFIINVRGDEGHPKLIVEVDMKYINSIFPMYKDSSEFNMSGIISRRVGVYYGTFSKYKGSSYFKLQPKNLARDILIDSYWERETMIQNTTFKTRDSLWSNKDILKYRYRSQSRRGRIGHDFMIMDKNTKLSMSIDDL